ncbi:hypothetical protein [Halapricum desulfuricans]|uniref:hypothetical protein n=1 Tax=Halapricum desulfuricans TaxID=2841257 RepID=UPI001E535D0F|nr:hypothetical protein [Halapricum desulfuricans]
MPEQIAGPTTKDYAVATIKMFWPLMGVVYIFLQSWALSMAPSFEAILFFLALQVVVFIYYSGYTSGMGT